jgi:hypothetical protein
VLTADGVEVAVLMDRGSQTLDELMQSGSLIFA